MVEDQSCVVVQHCSGKLGLPGETRDIIDDVGSMLKGSLCDRDFTGVNADRNLELAL